jgi:capsid protein
MLKAIRKSLGKLLGYEAEKAKLSRQLAVTNERLIKATYDAARTSTEYQNIWANTDAYDADSAHDKAVRHTLIQRSRYEIGSNGYSDGIAQTYATDLVGVGPQLRMQTGSPGFNRMVELQWHLWVKATQFRRKLWCLAHAKHQDGEGFGVLRRNPGINHPVKLDLCLYEAEQVQTPYPPFMEPGYIDGIKFDEFGNPLWYDILRQHPGTSRGLMIDMAPEKVPADVVLHWFKLRRPGQHRAVPECASTLNVGAASRRWREATLAAAETAADFTLLMKTQQTPDDADAVAPFTEMDITKRMMGFLPMGWDPFQMDAKFPTTNHEAFHKTLVNEQARPKSMPYNKAACDSSSYNYASGRLDHQTYYGSLDVDREDGNDLVLDKAFDLWFNLAISRFDWLGGNPDAVGPGARIHLWDWPKHRVADVEAEANANQTKLKSGQVFPHMLFTDAGLDAEDELEKAAEFYGVTVDEMRKRLFDVTMPPVQQGGAPGQQSQASDEAVAAVFRNLQRRGLLTNGHANGAHTNGN